MKITYIANARIPTERAHGVQIMKMCEAFAFSGAKVELIVPARFNPIKMDPFEYYGVKKNFIIKKIPCIDLVKFGRVGFLIQSFSFAIFSTIYTLFKNSDITYSRDEIPLWLLGFFKKNIVWEAHMPRDNRISRVLAQKSKKIVVISQGLKDFYISNGVPCEFIFVAHDGVDLKDFLIEVNRVEMKQKLNLPISSPIAMYVGRLDKWKGVKTLLDSSKFIKDVQVVIIGEGDELDMFKKEYENVIFTGPLPYRDLPYNQKAADVLVVPNSKRSKVSALYTSPLKVFAYMTSGTPIVASDLPSIREVLNENNSVLIKPNDPKKLAEGIKKVLQDSHFADRISRQAYSDVQNYTWQKRAESILSFIK